MKHLLSIADLSKPQAEQLLATAEEMHDVQSRPIKKLPALRGRTVVNLFFEDSTRTRTSFEIAGKWMSADTINVSGKGSSVSKGESLRDTMLTLDAMGVDCFVIRHGSSGAVQQAAGWVKAHVVNAGDGQHEHPTQALLDMLSMRRAFGRIAGLKVAICGDILHSRVARSNVGLLQMMGAEVRLVGPPTLMPAAADRWGAAIHHDMRKGIEGCDVVMMLRLQLERMDGVMAPSQREYFRFYGLDREKLGHAAAHVRVMHPGPMNRGVEIDSEVADDLAVSLIQDQVEMGVAARMAVLASLAARLNND